MRQAVRQARVTVVRKLIKEAKLLQGRKHGDEKALEKCKRKGQRLVAEIEALKKMKDDEITKFAIVNTRKLQEVLNDSTCEPATRVMCRLAFHKTVVDRVAKFKEKFPNYEEHLGPGRKKLSKLQRQANREARNAMKRHPGIDVNSSKAIPGEEEAQKNEVIDENMTEHSDESGNEEGEPGEDPEEATESSDSNCKVDNEQQAAARTINEADEENSEEVEKDLTAEHGLEPGSILRIKTPKSADKRKKSEKRADTETEDRTLKPSEKHKDNEFKKDKKKKGIKIVDEETTTQRVAASKAPSEPKKPKPIRVISKEASVKRFTELADANETEEIVREPDAESRSKKRDVKIEKQVDSFFMTENGESEYLSVVVPKSKLCEDDEQDERFSQNHAANRQKNFHERNNKFFSKIDQRGASGGRGDRHASNVAGRKRPINSSNGEGSARKFGREESGSGRNARPSVTKNVEAKEEVLHPSWAARKKQQEILKQGFQGKKIVFDD